MRAAARIQGRPRLQLVDQERELHATVAQFLRLALRAPTTWTTFPAGGGGLERGRMLARLGLRPGWPDVLVLHPAPTEVDGCRRVILVGLELKTEIGRQSTVQRERARARGRAAVCDDGKLRMTRIPASLTESAVIMIIAARTEPELVAAFDRLGDALGAYLRTVGQPDDMRVKLTLGEPTVRAALAKKLQDMPAAEWPT